jgi:YVTN family beta-propeller protein
MKNLLGRLRTAWTSLPFFALVHFAACREHPGAPKPYLAFVANNQSNSVAVVDLANFRLLATVPVASGPLEVAIRPGSRQVWVTSASGTLSVIRFPDLTVRHTVRVGASAQSLIFSADGRCAFVLDPADGQIVFLDSEAPKVVGRVRVAAPSETGDQGNGLEAPAGSGSAGVAPGSLALTPDGKTLVASACAPRRICFVSVESQKILGAADVGNNPGPMVILPDNSKVFVADTGEQKVSAVDVAARQLLAHLETASRPSVLLLKPDGGEIFVLSAPGSTLTIVDAFHDNVEQNLTTGRQPAAAVIRRNQSVLYIANAGDGSVTALDAENREVLSSTHTGTEPRSLALTPDERYLVVADAASSDVAILRTDATDNPASGSASAPRTALVTTVPVGARPIDVAIPDWLSGSAFHR